jgi:hypothetical protein
MGWCPRQGGSTKEPRRAGPPVGGVSFKIRWSFNHAGMDQLALEFGDAGQDVEHQAAMRRRRIHRSLTQRLKTDPAPPQEDTLGHGPRNAAATAFTC